jgi:hypothetical protein
MNSKKINLPYQTLANYFLRPISKPRHHRNRIAAGRAGKRPARTRAGIKHPFLCPVDRDLEFSNVPGMQVLAMTWRWIDDGGTFWPLIAMVQDGGPRSRWRHKIR